MTVATLLSDVVADKTADGTWRSCIDMLLLAKKIAVVPLEFVAPAGVVIDSAVLIGMRP